MKKGKREEDVVKISITAKRADDYIRTLEEIYLDKLMAKKKRMKSN